MQQKATIPLKQQALFRQHCLIDGEWQDSHNSERLDVTNPATGEVLGSVPLVTVSQTEQAIAAAEQALVEWRKKTGKERAALLQAWARLIMDNQDDLATLLTAEQGKPLAEARGKSPTPPALSTGLRKKPNVLKAACCNRHKGNSACWSSSSPLACVRRLRRGISWRR